jgi:hypothetical protein
LHAGAARRFSCLRFGAARVLPSPAAGPCAKTPRDGSRPRWLGAFGLRHAPAAFGRPVALRAFRLAGEAVAAGRWAGATGRSLPGARAACHRPAAVSSASRDAVGGRTRTSPNALQPGRRARGSGTLATGRARGLRDTVGHEDRDEAGEDRIDLADAVDFHHAVLALVVRDQRARLCLVHAQPVTDGFLVVVGTRAQRAAADVASAFELRRRRIHVVDPAAAAAGTPPGKALHEYVEVDVEQHRDVERLLGRVEQVIERGCLGKIAREAVEHEAARGVGVLDAFADHAEHDLVGTSARVHGGLGQQAQVLPWPRPLQVARGNLRYAVLLHEHLGLSAFSGPGCPQQYDSHLLSAPVLEGFLQAVASLAHVGWLPRRAMSRTTQKRA